MKIVQISDTHLSPSKTHFNDNWEPVARWIETVGADLVVHTGDLTIDGADQEEDIVFSMELMRKLSVPVLIVPGNHDVGHLPGSDQPVDAARLDRWRRLVGPDYWVSDHGNWRLIGLNSLLLGYGDEEEERQFQWLEQTLATRADRRVAIFAHKPLFVDEPLEGDTGYWSVKPQQRQRLYELMAENDVALHASGHLHWAWRGQHAGTDLLWAPPTSFIVDTLEREMPGERLVGAVLHHLEGSIDSEIVAIPGLTRYVIDPVIEEIYPRHARKLAEAAQ
ncbi:metallophosphoesterase family protein [Sinorhizobium americanum]|uniref:3',5'-cyclic adenosine monophosphate phosphodiesterase CpdA n=1 Tax=Sinorhizobium americanum TaxID=194963 RepID=A0A1L3LVY7_9HYPH|nr:metallophosphoesterase [Sinorhizobium americanum]APG94193.1 3',5'-cyclic adenosine monophosphate phosphodiesterase CpdA [Sinorhizobium americanum]OAP44304.1 metallophosphoesterase [Sinorhizobium americanum]